MDSYHHPTQNFSVPNTLVFRALGISDVDRLEEEMKQLDTIFRNIGYKYKDIRKAMKRAKGKLRSQSAQTHSGKVYLPFIQRVTDDISNILDKKYFTTQFIAPRRIKQRIKFVKDNSDHHQLNGVYKVVCLCDKIYIVEIGCSCEED